METLKEFIAREKIQIGANICSRYSKDTCLTIMFIGEEKVFVREERYAEESTIDLSCESNWQRYQEPKKKVKLYQWAYKDELNFDWKATIGFYRNEQEVRSSANGIGFIRLDHTMIEVDE